MHTLPDTDPVICKGCDPSLVLQVPGTLSNFEDWESKTQKSKEQDSRSGARGYTRKSQHAEYPQQVLNADRDAGQRQQFKLELRRVCEACL